MAGGGGGERGGGGGGGGQATMTLGFTGKGNSAFRSLLGMVRYGGRGSNLGSQKGSR